MVTHWAEPVIHWQPRLDAEERHERLAQTGEHLARWPAAPLEHAPTDCYQVGRDYWIWQPGVGGIRFSADRPELIACPSTSVDANWFERVVTRSWLPAVYQVWGRQVLHASAVVWSGSGDVLVLTGPTGSGKSTLAYGLGCRPGWRQVADDTLAFACVDGRVTPHPLPNQARLRPGAAAHFQRTGEPLEQLTWPEAPLQLARVYCVRGDAQLSTAAHVRQLQPAESYVRLLEQAHAFTLKVPELNRQLMRDYLALTTAVPAYELTYRKSFDALDAVFDILEQHLAAVPQNTPSTT